MNVETGAEAAQFPGKEYINGIAVAVWMANVQRTMNEMISEYPLDVGTSLYMYTR